MSPSVNSTKVPSTAPGPADSFSGSFFNKRGDTAQVMNFEVPQPQPVVEKPPPVNNVQEVFDPLGMASSHSASGSPPPSSTKKSTKFGKIGGKKKDDKKKQPEKKVEPDTATNDMTSLANLPPPAMKQNVVVSSFDDDGWGDADWDFDDVGK